MLRALRPPQNHSRAVAAPGTPSNPSRSCSSPAVSLRSCCPGVPGLPSPRSPLPDAQLQLPHPLQAAPQVTAGPAGDRGHLAQHLHPLQAALQLGHVLLGTEGTQGQSGTRSTKPTPTGAEPGPSRTRCRRRAGPGVAGPGSVPVSRPWPVVVAGGDTARSGERGVGGRGVARGEELVACKREES